jgi:hypothetical protein
MFEAVVALTTLPSLVVMLALATETAAGNVTTIWYAFDGPPARDSTPVAPVNGRLTSNVPALPCVFRETAVTLPPGAGVGSGAMLVAPGFGRSNEFK